VYVDILPTTAKIADGIKRALLGVGADVKKAARRWKEEIERELKGVDITLDTAKAKRELDRLEKEKHTATVDVDTKGVAKAEAELDVLTRDRKVEVKVDLDRDGAALGGLGSGAVSAATSAGGEIAKAMGDPAKFAEALPLSW
jgi:hypothetical protein